MVGLNGVPIAGFVIAVFVILFLWLSESDPAVEGASDDAELPSMPAYFYGTPAPSDEVFDQYA